MRNFIKKSMLWLLLLPTAVHFVGVASNQLVLFANDDKFPVMINQHKLYSWNPKEGMPADGMMDDTHCVMTSRTHLNLLADILDFHGSIESVGDELIDWSANYAGYVYFLWAILMLRRVGNEGRPN